MLVLLHPRFRDQAQPVQPVEAVNHCSFVAYDKGNAGGRLLPPSNSAGIGGTSRSSYQVNAAGGRFPRAENLKGIRETLGKVCELTSGFQ